MPFENRSWDVVAASRAGYLAGTFQTAQGNSVIVGHAVVPGGSVCDLKSLSWGVRHRATFGGEYV